MKHLGRWLFNLAATLSILGGLAASALWVRSYSVGDSVQFASPAGDQQLLRSILGRVHLISHLNLPPYTGGWNYFSQRVSSQSLWNGGMSDYPARVEWHGGFVWQQYTKTYVSFLVPGQIAPVHRLRLIVVPYWFIITAMGITPIVRLVVLIRSLTGTRRAAANLCIQCGYDLRATPERCPECGAIPEG